MPESESQDEVRYIAVAGNIGAGKSSLTDLLSRHLGWEAFYESVDDNPYLEDFYNDMRRWSFNLQIYFLSSRFRNHKEMLDKEDPFVQDRTIFEDAEIFARNLYQMGLMSKRDYSNYHSLYKEMTDFLPSPDLLIYLRAQVPTLVRQIQQRGREYENTIRIEYLERLNKLYEEWITNYSHEKLIIDTDEMDFVNNREDKGQVIDRVERRMFGLF